MVWNLYHSNSCYIVVFKAECFVHVNSLLIAMGISFPHKHHVYKNVSSIAPDFRIVPSANDMPM